MYLFAVRRWLYPVGFGALVFGAPCIDSQELEQLVSESFASLILSIVTLIVNNALSTFFAV